MYIPGIFVVYYLFVPTNAHTHTHTYIYIYIHTYRVFHDLRTFTAGGDFLGLCFFFFLNQQSE
jgi:hypothetical protein